MRKQTFALAGLLAAFAAGSATATPLTIQNPTATPVQQTNNSPCIFGDPSCNNPAGFGFTLIPNLGGSSQNYDLLSTLYTVGQIRALVGDHFQVGIDVNSSGKTPTETLVLFTADILSTPGVDFTYTGPTQLKLGGTPGNGWSDVTLSGFDLTGLPDLALIQFRVALNDDRAGREEYFLIGTPSPTSVPEPASLALLGGALVGLGAVRRHRRS